jgi:membrane protein DedA with SNARE-associated domain
MSFEQIVEFIRYQNEFIIYGILLISAFIENLFPPFPGDTMTLAGAFLAGEGNIGYMGVLVSATSGGLLGMLALFYLGRLKGRKFFEHRDSNYFGRQALVKVENLFQKYGDSILLISRFLAGVRSAIAIAAGLGNVRPYRMAGLSLISFLLWNGMLVGLMVVSKSNWEMIKQITGQYTLMILALGALLGISYIAIRIWRTKKS